MQLDVKPVIKKTYNCRESIIASAASYLGLDYEMMFIMSWGFNFEVVVSESKYTRLGDRIDQGWGDPLSCLKYFHGLEVVKNNFTVFEQNIELIKSELKEERCIGIYIDAYFCPWNPAFNKSHIIHYCLAVGFDDASEILLCIDPYISNKTEYLPLSVYEKGYGECLTFKKTNIQDEKPILNYVLGLAIDKMRSTERGLNSFGQIREFAECLQRSFDVSYEILECKDIRFLPLIRKIVEIGNNRLNFSIALEYIEKKYGFNEVTDFKNRMVIIWRKWSQISTWLIKAFLSDNSLYPIGIVSSLIREVADIEEKFAEELYELMKKNIYSINSISDDTIEYENNQNSMSLRCPNASCLISTESVFQKLFSLENNVKNSIALVFKEKTLTYQELNKRSNQLARTLRNKGTGKNCIVGIMAKRSLEMIIGLLAIIKAGGSYLPIDPDYPESRITYMLDDSKTRVLITQKDLYNKIHFDGELVDINNEDYYDKDSSNLQIINIPTDLVYVIYTSGSTGRPKGVMIEHKALSNFIKGVTEVISFTSNSTILALTTISFDIFVLETLLALAKGIKIVLADEEQQRDPKLLSEVITNSNVDMLQITPSRLKILMSSPKNLVCLRNLKVIMIGGEQLPQKLLDELKKVTSARIYNMYGPTETTVWSTIKDLTNCKEINIGKPIANTQIYIVDNENKLVDVGQEGEICISGDGLARGYFNRPELTSEKFIQNPFRKGNLMYKTGDIGKCFPDGDIECLGRIDYQVKIRGYRIELEEIENQLSKVSGIKDSVVIAKENSYGDNYLVAYYISNRELAVAEINSHLNRNLPEYMIPSIYIRLDFLPMTPNGKIDRKALPEPQKDRSNLQTVYSAPRNEVEETIVQIWKEVLKREVIGVNDNFFELGGNSLLVVVMNEEIEKHFPEKVDISDILAYSTVYELSKYIIQKESASGAILNSIKLPQDYFIKDNYNNKNLSLSINIKDDFFMALKRISTNLNILIENILASLFIYLLSNATEQTDIPIYTMFNNANTIELMKVDISEVSELNELIILTNQIIQRTSELQSLGIEIIKKIQSKSLHSVTPAICLKKYIRNDFVEAMDIVLVLDKEEEFINITLEFSNTKLNSNRIKDMFIKYVKLLKFVTEESQE